MDVAAFEARATAAERQIEQLKKELAQLRAAPAAAPAAPASAPAAAAPTESAEAPAFDEKATALLEAIEQQGNKVRTLKSAKAAKADIEAAVQELLATKAQFKAATGQDPPVAGTTAKVPKKTAAEKTSSQKFELKTPKGMRDYGPAEMAVRQKVFSTIVGVFKRHGAVTLETPVMELKATLTGKYGEDSKLIYDVMDQGGEMLALRYDLTVPFARYVAQNKIKRIKRYHIARVYRRDNPAMSRGRYREFYQCDIDFAGTYAPLVPDSECVAIVHTILTQLEMGPFVIKVNHRKVLDGMFAVAGVPAAQFRTISSSVDKLDKEPWENVRAEMVGEKGLSGEVADRIGKYVQLSGSLDLIKTLREDAALYGNASAKEGIDDMEILLKYCDILGVLGNVRFDCSLARGLDYYTGVIYEAVLTGAEVGSVAGGGRYDNLVGMFESSGQQVPCVGVSIGIERLFAILQKRVEESNVPVRESETDVMVMSGEKGMLDERLRLCAELWKAGIRAEGYFNKANDNLLSQFQTCEKALVPLAVIIGGDELKNNVVTVRKMGTREDFKVPRGELADKIKSLLA
eukprot:m.90512 g.90512  ORF g.90512 m.90512 type:complete len:574 (-) comp8466_c1_seq2:3256-4977(-)